MIETWARLVEHNPVMFTDVEEKYTLSRSLFIVPIVIFCHPVEVYVK